MTVTTRSKGKDGKTKKDRGKSRVFGKLKNGDLVLQIQNRIQGVHFSQSDLETIPRSVAGFYLVSKPEIGVLKLGKSDSGNLRERVKGTFRYWGGNGSIHVLRSFHTSPRLDEWRPEGGYLIQSPKAWASKFELDVKRKLNRGNREFYSTDDINMVLDAIDSVIDSNSKNPGTVYTKKARTRGSS